MANNRNGDDHVGDVAADRKVMVIGGVDAFDSVELDMDKNCWWFEESLDLSHSNFLRN